MALILSDLTPPPCEECGMGTVHHRLERFSLRLDALADLLFKPLDVVTRPLMPLMDHAVNRTGPFIASALFSLGLATKLAEMDPHIDETSQALWEEAERRGISIYEVRLFGLPRRHFVARHGESSLVFQGIPRLPRRQPSINWIDDKAEMKKRFQTAGFPVALGGSANTEKRAMAIFRSLEKPAIVKPQKGSGGRHTTVNITTEEGLRAAFHNAMLIAPSVVVEEELFGPVFRATLIDRKLAGILRRDPPHVTGDGRSTVQELVIEENKNPLRRGPAFAEIKVDTTAARRELTKQNLKPDSVPAKGKKVFFHFKVNWGVGGTSHDATPEVHPDNKELFEKIGAYLGDDIVGIDFMIDDIAISWKETSRCGVIECNSLPAIGNHHFPFTGPVQNVAAAVWDMVFPGTGSKTQKAPN